jgi:hypothetical protein
MQLVPRNASHGGTLCSIRAAARQQANQPRRSRPPGRRSFSASRSSTVARQQGHVLKAAVRQPLPRSAPGSSSRSASAGSPPASRRHSPDHSALRPANERPSRGVAGSWMRSAERVPVGGPEGQAGMGGGGGTRRGLATRAGAGVETRPGGADCDLGRACGSASVWRERHGHALCSRSRDTVEPISARSAPSSAAEAPACASLWSAAAAAVGGAGGARARKGMLRGFRLQSRAGWQLDQLARLCAWQAAQGCHERLHECAHLPSGPNPNRTLLCWACEPRPKADVVHAAHDPRAETQHPPCQPACRAVSSMGSRSFR